MTTNDDQEFRTGLAAGAARARVAVRDSSANARATALAAAKQELAQLRERELARIKRAVGATETAHAAALEALEADVESKRRERAAELLAKAFADDALPALIAKWRTEPGRAATAALQKVWKDLDAVAREELGEPLGVHVLAAAFVNHIAAQIPGGLSRLCSVLVGNVEPKAVAALGEWSRATEPAAGADALGKLEAALLAVARRGEGAAVEAHHVEQHALLRQNATRRDLSAAFAVHTERERKAALERFEATYVPPPQKPSLSARVMSWLGD